MRYRKPLYVLETDIGFAVTELHAVHGIVTKKPIELVYHSDEKDAVLKSLIAEGKPMEALFQYRQLTGLPYRPARRHLEELGLSRRFEQ